jgi:fused signal recognition particle receptor
MAFWRRRREEPEEVESAPTVEPEPPTVEPEPPVVEPERPVVELERPASSESESFEIEGLPTPGAQHETVPERPFEIEGSVSEGPPAEAAPAYAPFDPTAFLAVAPAHTLDDSLEKTRGAFMSQLRGYLGGADGPAWDEVEETLIAGDVGAALAIDLVERARSRRHPDGPEGAIREELAALLVERDADWSPRPAASGGPAVVLVVGVNGTGKTTTIGKMAARYLQEGRSIILAAADTFRAAAIDQLRIWADRAAVPVIAHAPGADPGAVVYDALDAAIARGADMVIADTAGRLHTKTNLMDELTKVRRIVDKRLPGAQPETLFVLDATTGQNGLAQAKAFHDAVGLTGIVLTKLDSTAKGGIVFAIEDGLKVPVRFVGVGEGINDLLPFDPKAFVDALFAEPQAPTG